MSQIPSNQAISIEKQDLVSPANLSTQAKSNLTKMAAWISDRNNISDDRSESVLADLN
jgi:hypothetical protein